MLIYVYPSFYCLEHGCNSFCLFSTKCGCIFAKIAFAEFNQIVLISLFELVYVKMTAIKLKPAIIPATSKPAGGKVQVLLF